MMSNNKILTVSYGTFSCTLEGFDDSFGTMKAIAEYFRELSSDAPYFGAEPPQPDADMLARIAQREISRRVEAREHEGKIHLSALENHTGQQAATPQPEAAIVEPEITVADTAKVAVAAVAGVAVDAARDETPAVADHAPAKADEASDVAESTAAVEDAESADVEEVEEVASAAQDVEEVTDEEKGTEEDIVPGQPDADVEAFFATTPQLAELDPVEDEYQDIEVAELTTTSTAPSGAPDSIAAKLQRIRAVVAQHDDTADENDFVEDQHAEADAEPQIEPDHIMADARRDIEDALEADEAADRAPDVDGQEFDEDDDDITAILDRLGAAGTDSDTDEDADDDTDLVSTQTDAVDFSDEIAENLFGEDAEGEADEVAQVQAPRMEGPRARVIKVKRADLEAAIENGELEEYADDQHDDDVPSLDDLAPARTATSSLSEEDEDELARELAALEADMTPDTAAGSDEFEFNDASRKSGDTDGEDTPRTRADDEDTSLVEDDGEDDASEEPAAASRRVLPSIDDAQGEDMDRLLAETDQQMDEPESTTRRNAFSHLRAAVAAKKADVAMGSADKTVEEDDAYRSDLAEVVRPRRPVGGTPRTERPGEARPAPLKLVAEQRIDVATPRAAGPVRPRRVAALAEAVSTDVHGESFADYAAGMGATKLPQLLEAAASYMSFVEGREQFSRPQLMTKVRQVGPEEGFSREDGLRSFGQLLRAGKIEKIKGGRFTVSDDIGYRPDHRAAG